MARELAANVWVGGVYYAAGSTPPKEVADQITNPKAWGDEPAEPAKPVPFPAAPPSPDTVVGVGAPMPVVEPAPSAKKTVAKKATAKKAPAKKAAAKKTAAKKTAAK